MSLSSSALSVEVPALEHLRAIWCAVLDLDDVRTGDDLFDLGGDSIDAIRILARVRERFGVSVDIASFLRHATLAHLAVAIEAEIPIPDSLSDPDIPRPTRFPLTSAQTRLWFLDSWIADRQVYNVSRLVRIRGVVDADRLRRAWSLLVDRHEILRTRIVVTDGVPVQEPLPRVPVVVKVHSFPDDCDGDEIVLAASSLAAVPFDLARAPLWRCVLFLAADRSWLSIVMHHIVTDGWSMGPLFRELGEAYAALRDDRFPDWPPIRRHFGDCAIAQRAECWSETLEWWKLHLADLPAPADLPMARRRPRLQSFRGAVHRFELSAADREPLDELCRIGRLTRAQMFLSVFAVLIHRLARADDLLVGMPIAVRRCADTDSMIGPLINTVVVRLRVRPDDTFAGLLAHVRDVVRSTLARSEIPLETLIEELRPPRDLSRQPFFQLAFLHQNHPGLPDRFAGLPMEPRPIHNATAMFDLRLVVEEPANPSAPTPLWIEYNTELFDVEVVARMAGHYRELLGAFVADPDRPISQPCLLTPPERLQIVESWNDTAHDDEPGCLHDAFERHARTCPNAIAIATASESWTYGELASRSGQIARGLIDGGLVPGSFVGVCLPRTPDAIAAILGIVRAGAAYVPLDPAYPEERLQFMARDCRARTIVVDRTTRDRLDGEVSQLVDLDSIEDDAPSEFSIVLVRPTDRVYAIYTSGSTGRPKGVVLRHGAVANTLRWANETFGVGPSDRLLFVTSMSFDLSVYDIFGTLSAGASIRLADEREIREPARLMRILRGEAITIWDSAPAALAALMPFAPTGSARSRGGQHLRLVMLSGDWIAVALPDAIRAAFPLSQIASLGGATEAAIWSNYHPVGIVDPGLPSIPYGRPIRNCRYHILDSSRHPVPMGVPGELYIGGACLADGYLYRPELTAERFVADPLRSRDPEARLYRTGDIARYYPDATGDIEFLGRIDHQVKIRGYRVELGEIESALERIGGVRQAATIAPSDGVGGRYLVAFAVGDRRAIEGIDLAARLRESLPAHMIPSEFVILDEMPLTPSRKIDRAALIPPGRTEKLGSREYVGPRNNAELALQAIWEDVLGVSPIGVTDSFYDLGGHSLKAAVLMSRIQTQLGHALPLELLLVAPTIRSLAIPLQKMPQLAAGALVPLQSSGSRTPLFLTTGAGGHVFTFHRLARVAGSDTPTYGLKAYGTCGTETPPDDFEAIAARYMAEILAERPRGPYRLAGYSVGGQVAFELARQMELAGHTIERLIVLDAFAPGYWRKQTWGRWLTAKARQLLRRRWKAVRGRVRDLRDRWSSSAASKASGPSPELDPAMRATFRAVWEGLARARNRYRPGGPIRAPITLIGSGGGPEPGMLGRPDPRRGWDEFTTDAVAVHYVAGDHGEIFADGNLSDLARWLSE